VGSGGSFSVRRKAHKSVFPSLIVRLRRIGRGARKRNDWKNAFVCSRRQAVRRRWAGLVRKILWVLLKVSSNLVQQTPPKTICRLARRFAPRFGWHFRKIIPGFFEFYGERARRKAAVHKLLSLHCAKGARADGFSFAFSESQNEIRQIVDVVRCLSLNHAIL
jgi:hypothetical protein